MLPHCSVQPALLYPVYDEARAKADSQKGRSCPHLRRQLNPDIVGRLLDSLDGWRQHIHIDMDCGTVCAVIKQAAILCQAGASGCHCYRHSQIATFKPTWHFPFGQLEALGVAMQLGKPCLQASRQSCQWATCPAPIPGLQLLTCAPCATLLLCLFASEPQAAQNGPCCSNRMAYKVSLPHGASPQSVSRNLPWRRQAAC